MQIKPPGSDHFFDTIRYEITDGLLLPNAIPDKSGGNIQHGRIDHFNIRMLFKF